MDFLTNILDAGTALLNAAAKRRREVSTNPYDPSVVRDPGPLFSKASNDDWTAIPDNQYPEGIPKVGTVPVIPVKELNETDIPENRALLDTISFAEGTWGDKEEKPRYDIAYNYNTIDPNKPHPDIVFKGGKRDSAAAGAYQIMPGTWKWTKKGINLPMTPQNQDNAALWLAKRRGWNPDKTFREQAHLLAPEWASLPTKSGKGYYPGQGPKSRDALYEYDKFYRTRLEKYMNR